MSATHSDPHILASEAAATTLATTKTGISLGQAADILVARDHVIATLLDQNGPPALPHARGGHFEALVRAIVFQQLAGAAAAAIYGRLRAALNGHIEPESLHTLSEEQLRIIGLSKAKALSVRELAAKVLDGTVSLSRRVLGRQTDDEVEACLRTVRGIGPWTAQVFMMFQLGRLDIWLTSDLGVRRGYSLAWGVPMPNPRELEPLGDLYRPYRTVLTWSCWKAAELYGRATGR